jgi:adenine phosphoribosyltransferase
MEHLKALIRTVPDFPQPGIVFRDIMPLLRQPRALAEVVEHFTRRFEHRGIDLVAGVESRGFFFGPLLAQRLGVGFAPIRKLGKLPGPTAQREYALEYGSNHLEMQRAAVVPGERVVLIDDVLATGGTARAGLELIRELGGEPVAAAFVIELVPLGGRAVLQGEDVFALLAFGKA